MRGDQTSQFYVILDFSLHISVRLLHAAALKKT
jgi:hypothetical protein